MYYNGLLHLILAFIGSVLVLKNTCYEEAIKIPYIPFLGPFLDPPLSRSLAGFSTFDLTVCSSKLTQIPIIHNAYCPLKSFGYSSFQANSLFPDRKFKNCSDSNEYYIYETSSNSLKLQCPNPEICRGTHPSEEKFGEVKFPRSWENSTEKVRLGHEEFVFIKCGKKISVHYKLYENKTIAENARKISEKISQAVGRTFSPLAVHIIMFDSLSRQSFYRNFPKTLSWLNTTLTQSYNSVLLEFPLSIVHGEDTQPNLIPIFYGHSSGNHWDLLHGLSIFNKSDQAQFIKIQENAIWNTFKKKGFVTMFGYDTVWDFFSYTTGRIITTDHISSNFFHAAHKLVGYEDFWKDIQCIGNQSSDFYLLKYLNDFAHSYHSLNKFSYIHMSQGHEHSGTVIRTVDINLKYFLSSIISFYNATKTDYVIFLGGDHGKHSKEWDKTYEGYLENHIPALFVISNKEFLSKHNSKAHLNTHSLISRLDIHLTLKHLAVCPYGTLKENSPLYKTWTKHVGNNAKSLFIGKFQDRTCSEMGIADFLCPCEGLKAVDRYEEQYPLVLAEYIARKINMQIIDNDLENVCMTVSVNKIITVMEQKLKSNKDLTRLIQVEFDVKEVGESKVKANGLLTTIEEMGKIGGRIAVETQFMGKDVAIRLDSFERTDEIKNCMSSLICYCKIN